LRSREYIIPRIFFSTANDFNSESALIREQLDRVARLSSHLLDTYCPTGELLPRSFSVQWSRRRVFSYSKTINVAVILMQLVHWMLDHIWRVRVKIEHLINMSKQSWKAPSFFWTRVISKNQWDR
jgi:hypothetical protein